jgi:anthranilate synthase/aminodeoxychorismate synthase-like glutamine amidotransferase
MARILVIDSYDSFVYNIVQYLGELGAEPVVVRNDQLTVDEAVALAPDGVGHVYGGDVVRAPHIMHGKTSFITHNNTGVFEGLPSPLEATRYHSLVIDKASMPAELVITAETSEGIVMGVRHRDVDVEGVQFHPESILTASGHDLLSRFLQRCN